MGVIMTNTEIKFHILLFTLSSSSKISDPLSYCHSILSVLRIFHLLGVLLTGMFNAWVWSLANVTAKASCSRSPCVRVNGMFNALFTEWISSNNHLEMFFS